MPFRSLTLPLILLSGMLSNALFAQSVNQTIPEPNTSTSQTDKTASLSFAGSEACQECHEEQFQAWAGSDHRHAFAPANNVTVKGSFDDVAVDYTDGKAVFSRNDRDEYLITVSTGNGEQSYPVKYTLGHYPLQQYLLETEAGKYQVFALAWDTRSEAQGGQRWIEIQPGEIAEDNNPFHWTGYFQNWNSQCADCHTTDYEKGYQAATAEGPSSYQSRWSEAGVGCEACHGPASQHLEWAAEAKPDQPNGLLTSLISDRTWAFRQGESIASLASGSVSSNDDPYLRTCARCHSLRHPLGETTYERVPADDKHSAFTDQYYPQLVTEPQYFVDGQIREEVFVYGSFLQSKMHNAGVSCGNCHNPHSGKVLQFDADNISHPGNDAVCAQCHRADVFAVTEHHQHPLASEAARCVSCHMPATTYMLVDPRRDHSFSVPSPALSTITDAPNACTGCHTDESDSWAAAQVDKWRGNKEPPKKDFASWQIAAAQIQASGSQQQWQQLEQQRHDLLSLASTPQMKRAMLLQAMPVFNQQSFDALAGRLSDDDVVVRLAAIDQLSGAEPAARARFLTPLLNDKSKSVRLSATLALADLLQQPQYPERGLLQQRVDEYINAYQRHEDLLVSQTRLAALYQRTANHEKAAEAYRTALDLVPGVVSTLLNLADTYRALQRDDEGEKLLLQAEAIAEKEIANLAFRYNDAAIAQQGSVQYALGLLYVRVKDHTQALERFLSSMTLQPNNDQPFYAYLLTLDALGRRDEALEQLQYSPLTQQSPRLQQLVSAWRTR